MTDPINMDNAPLTVRDVVTIISILCMDGEVHVTGCAKNSQDVHRILTAMNSRLSDADKAWIKATVAEEMERAK
jgi:hypothetical protein